MGLSFARIQLRQGFTLIEIMVVVAIIGILASVLFVSFEEGRQQSRDKFRQAELKELQLAIELYKAQYGQYPEQGCLSGPNNSGVWSGPGPLPSWGVTCDQYIVGLAPDFVASLPRDPNKEDEDGKGFIYRTNADRSAYKVLVHQSVESQLVTSAADEFARCPQEYPGYVACTPVRPTEYAIYSVGAENW